MNLQGKILRLLLLALMTSFVAGRARATDLTLPVGGIVTVELVGSDAAFHNTLSLVSPAASVFSRGCTLEPSIGLGGLVLLSEKTSQRGCRVTLDANPGMPGLQPFPAGTVLRFNMCAQLDADNDCDFIWSSNPGDNPDGFDHVRITSIHAAQFPGQIFQLNWEDQSGGGDLDFNDLIATVRISQDSDGDGLWDDWEMFGIDTDGDGVVDLNLPALGASVNHRDIFLHIDFMDCTEPGGDCPPGDTHSHRPMMAAINAVVAAFANAPVANPDGTMGINLHVEVGSAVPHQRFLLMSNACFASLAGTPGIGDFDAVKQAAFGMNNPRRYAYHYCLFTHNQCPTSSSGGSFCNSSGCGELPGNDFMVSMGAFSSQTGTLQEQAGTLMHEFGHNLGLRHGGGDNVNRKPNYLSIMNYTFQLGGIPPTDPDGPGGLSQRLDYSRGALPTLDENNLSEAAGLGDGTDNTVFFCPDGTTRAGTGMGAVDWNCDGDTADSGLMLDINNEGGRTMLFGFNDWANLRYDFQSSPDFDDGVHETVLPEPELDVLTYLQTLTPDVAVAISATPNPVVTGAEVTYTITVANRGPAAAHDVTVTDDLPAETTYVSCAASGGVCGGSGNHRTVTFAILPGGEAATITLVASVNCTVPSGSAINNAVLAVTPEAEQTITNNTASATVTASDPLPVITCPPDKTVEFKTIAGAVVNYPPPVVTDNCPGATTACTPPSGSTFPIGTNTVHCTVADSTGQTASCAFTVIVLGPFHVKQNVLNELKALRASVTDRKDGKELDDAIEELGESLDPSLWVNQTHLQPKHGDRSLKEEKKSVHELLELVKSRKSLIPDATLRGFINRIVKSDRLLAEVAIRDATLASGDAKKIAKAGKELLKGDEDVAEGKDDDAISDYRDAWEKAMDAVK